jgi:hypothetical protein
MGGGRADAGGRGGDSHDTILDGHEGGEVATTERVNENGANGDAPEPIPHQWMALTPTGPVQPHPNLDKPTMVALSKNNPIVAR